MAKQVEATNKKIGRLPMSAINMLIHDVIDGQDAPFIYERMGQMIGADSQLNQTEHLCPACGSELIRRKGRYGEFYGCSSFPGCRYTRNV